jgi:hypothetical protein
MNRQRGSQFEQSRVTLTPSGVHVEHPQEITPVLSPTDTLLRHSFVIQMSSPLFFVEAVSSWRHVDERDG